MNEKRFEEIRQRWQKRQKITGGDIAWLINSLSSTHAQLIMERQHHEYRINELLAEMRKEAVEIRSLEKEVGVA